MLRVLLVTRESDFAHAIHRALLRHSICCVSSISIRDALRTLGTGLISVALVDLDDSMLSGEGLLETIAEHFPTVRRIGISLCADLTAGHGAASNADSIVLRPVDLGELLGSLQAECA